MKKFFLYEVAIFPVQVGNVYKNIIKQLLWSLAFNAEYTVLK
jgi:hypothetical protein